MLPEHVHLFCYTVFNYSSDLPNRSDLSEVIFMFSKDILDEVEALNAIQAIETEKDLRAFIKGESREPMLDAAQFRINALRPKQGEQLGPITQKTSEFKVGIDGTKDVSDTPHFALRTPHSVVTGHDIIDGLDKAAFAHAQEVQRSIMEAESAKDAKAAAEPKAHVTIEDVLAAQRAEGRKV